MLECLLASAWRDTTRLAEIVVAKEPPFGGVVTCAFQVDLACLGLKWAFVSQFHSRREYEEQFLSLMVARCDLVPVEFSLVAKVLREALRYGRLLGFEPPPQVTSTLSALGPIDQAATGCRVEVPLGGPDGRPLYMAGPEDDADAILATLTRTTSSRPA